MPFPAPKMKAFQAAQKPPMAPHVEPDGDEGAGGGDMDVDKAVAKAHEMIAAGQVDPQITQGMAGYDGSGTPPAWATDAAKWHLAALAVDPQPGDQQAWIVVAQAYHLLGGASSAAPATPAAQPGAGGGNNSMGLAAKFAKHAAPPPHG
jgi:hypothetical protein